MLYRDSTVYTLINSSFLQILSSGLNTLSPDKTQNLTVIVIGVSSTVRALDLVLCSQSLMFSINCFCKLFVFVNCLPSSLLVSLKCWVFFFRSSCWFVSLLYTKKIGSLCTYHKQFVQICQNSDFVFSPCIRK